MTKPPFKVGDLVRTVTRDKYESEWTIEINHPDHVNLDNNKVYTVLSVHPSSERVGWYAKAFVLAEDVLFHNQLEDLVK